jgi:hypothetical protein
MRTGYFDKAVADNEHATMDDRAYMHTGPDDSEEGGYYNHNLSMLISAYEMEGDSAGAGRVAHLLVDQGNPLAQIYFDARFHRWDDALEMSAPSGASGMAGVMWHFLRGMAYTARGRYGSAQTELTFLREATMKMHSFAAMGIKNSSFNLIHMAAGILEASLARAQGDSAKEVAALQRAVDTQDALIYTEPPDFYLPVRESLGGALLRQGKAAQAERVFRDDLARNPRNPRSLFGLSAALVSEGRKDEARTVAAQFDDAWKHADIKLTVADL